MNPASGGVGEGSGASFAPGPSPVPPQPVLPSSLTSGPQSAATPTREGVHIVRPAPQPGQGSFADLAFKSVMTRARDQDRFEIPVTPTAPVKQPLPIRGLLWGVVGLIILGIASGFVYVRYFRTVEQPPPPITTASVQASARTRTPQDTVLGYLEALRDGDIDKALSFGPDSGQGSRILLREANHNRMDAAARPTDVQVITTDPLGTDIQAQYTINGQVVQPVIRVVRTDDGWYELKRTSVTVRPSLVNADRVPLLINGVEVPHDGLLEVVPGTYVPSTGLPFIDYPDATIQVPYLDHADGVRDSLIEPQLTAQGVQALESQVRASLSSCLAQKTLHPAGCPNSMSAPGNRQVQPSSIQWTLTNSPWSSFKPILDAADKSVGVATLTLRFNLSVSFTDGSTSPNNPVDRVVRVSAPVTGRSADGMTVTWSE